MPSIYDELFCSSFPPELDLLMTDHAEVRMAERRIPLKAVDAVLSFGREIPTRGGMVYAIGRKEVAYYARSGVDLTEYNGLQVVCSVEGVVLTVYRNHNFRQLRVGLGRGRYNRVANRQPNRISKYR